jgi:hypothetical protein
MKLELKEYQDEAVAKVTTGLRKGTGEFKADGEYTAVSLSAPTGAGKTVIAAAVIERILFGEIENDGAGDGDAVFLWLTDDPSLNEQTKKKIRDASDRILPAQLITLNDNFDSPEFERGRVYFLNIQKLSRTSKLVTKREGKRITSLWDTISNTIRAIGGHFYLVIDEAHRGTGKATREEQTIAQRLMNGNGTVIAAPVVLGISATPDRFERAVLAGAQVRVPRKVVVPVAAVRESGLIKDVLSISYREDRHVIEATLLRDAVSQLRQFDDSWSKYTVRELEPPVNPVLVLQIPPNASKQSIGDLLDVCIEEWNVLGRHHALAHSLESHSTEEFGSHAVPYVKPQDIQDHPALRLVIFKEALTTGWDCPRAEVMVSLRAATDDTYIAQLIGRMVRSPLARRIESDESLNRVRLYLPRFDKSAVLDVKAKLESDDGGLPTEIEINSVDAHRNPLIPSEAFSVVESLPSYQVPGPVHRSQVARLHKLAALLVGDGILPAAIRAADTFLISVLGAERVRLQDDETFDRLIADVETATVGIVEFGAENVPTYLMETFETDIGDLDRMFATARRRLRDGLAERYWGHLVSEGGLSPYVAKAETVALSLESSVVDRVEEEAGIRSRQWLDTYGDAIASLSEDRKARYAEVRAMAREPELVSLSLPLGSISMSGDAATPSYAKHLYSDGTGNYRTRLGGMWEEHGLSIEMGRSGFRAWYRNPTGGQRALRIPYWSDGGWKRMYPDLVVIAENDEGVLRASLIDPHGHYFADAGDKLRGLAAYADRHSGSFERFLSVVRMRSGEFRMIDFADEAARSAVSSASTQEEIEDAFTTVGSLYE